MDRPVTFFGLLLTLLTGLCACHKPGCLDSGGSTTTVEHKAAPFHQIDLFDNIDLVLTQDSVEKIRVEAGTYLQLNIVADISGGVLTIQNTTSCAWLREPSEKITVYVSFITLDRINYNGSGRVSATDTLKLPELRVSSETGAGNVELTVRTGLLRAFIDHENADFIIQGIAEECHAYTNSRGTLDLSELQVRRFNMRYGAVKDTYIQVSERLEVEIYFKGNVYYKGDPQIMAICHDTGRLIKAP